LHLAAKTALGPSPSFEGAHILLAFRTIGETKLIGRKLLAVRSGLGEGAVRTVLKKLREGGYADANASGCYLTSGGRKVYAVLSKELSVLVPLEGSKLTVGSSQVALVVRGAGRKVRTGIEQRDSAIMVGASGATTYVLRRGKFTIPGGSSDCEKDFPGSAWGVLRRGLKPKGGDAMILCGAEDRTNAQLGALSAALTLL